MNRSRTRCVAVISVLLSTIGLYACSNQGSKGSVSVLGPWIGTEKGTEGSDFKQVLDAFTAETGIHVNYQGTRALTQVLLSKVQTGTPPDVAMLSPGELAKYARNGELYPLDDVIDQTQRAAFSQLWLLPLPQEKDGKSHIYTVPIKVNLGGLVWFSPTRTPQPTPRTWDELVTYSQSIADGGTAPWCMGMGDAPNSGWPGSDMIEEIFLQKFGPDRYQQWSAGRLPWTSDEVKQAWRMWGVISSDPRFVGGGPHAALFTDFGNAARPMFANPPGCILEHQASFMMNFYRNYKDEIGSEPRPGVDFNFFPFPASGQQNIDKPWRVSADLAGMFNDKPQARELIRYLATEKSQQVWPGIDGSSAFTANKNVSPEVYGNDNVSKHIDSILRSHTLCLNDLMPATMLNAFRRAVLEYLNDPKQLDTLLTELEKIRSRIPRADWLDLPCGR